MTKTTIREETITISLREILAAIQMIVERAAANGLTEVTLGHDWYWCLDPDEAFDMVQPPPELIVGDLFDDAEIVARIENRKDGLIGLHLSQIASLLDYIGSEYPSLDTHRRERAVKT
jgi:hypothetical protein